MDYPLSGWYAGYTSNASTFRWVASLPPAPMIDCGRGATVRPMSLAEGFSAYYWTDPTYPPDPENHFPGCESRNGTWMSDAVGPIEPMRPWRDDDPYPQAELDLDSLDPTPDPPDPPELETEICRHLVSGLYPGANELLGKPCDEELALMFRPWMRFDSSEHWRPLDVDAFFGEQFQGAPLHQLCNHPAYPSCVPLTSISQLDGADDDTYVSIDAAYGAAAPPANTDQEFYKSPNAGCVSADVWDCDGGTKC